MAQISFDTHSLEASIKAIKNARRDPSRKVYREQGLTAVKFSELAFWWGYDEAQKITDFMLTRVDHLPQNCLLFTTYRVFSLLSRVSESQKARHDKQTELP